MPISSKQYKQESEELQMFLGEIGDFLERTSGFVRRNSKLGGKELVQIMSLGALENGKASLDEFVQVGSDLGLEITCSGLHQRLNMEAVELLSQVLHLWIQQAQSHDLRAVLAGFGAVRIFDSSQMSLAPQLAEQFRGTRKDAGLKVQLAYEYRRGRIEALEVEAACVPDQNSDLAQSLSEAGDLAIMDLGYFDQQRFAQLEAQGAYFLSRLQSQTGLYAEAEDKQQLDILEQLNALPKSVQSGEQRVYLGQKAKVPVRLIYYRLNSEVRQERRRKAKENAKQRKMNLSQRALDFLDWAFFITNAPVEILSLEAVGIVYRVRWQIELIFKVWKQEMDWAFMANWRLERVLSQFYGRCLALLIFHRLCEKYQAEWDWELCWQKAFRLLKRCCSKLIAIVKASFWGILKFLQDLDKRFRRFGQKTKRRKDPSTYTLLQLIGA